MKMDCRVLLVPRRRPDRMQSVERLMLNAIVWNLGKGMIGMGSFSLPPHQTWSHYQAMSHV